MLLRTEELKVKKKQNERDSMLCAEELKLQRDQRELITLEVLFYNT
jgi:hypothetical protein